MQEFDAIIIGSGPNGLSAGIELAKNNLKVLILEASETVGGGMRTGSITLPGFLHDHCSAVHPSGVLSPYFKKLPLKDFGLEWIYPEASVAHPLDDQPSVMLYKSVEKTIESLGNDAENWKKLFSNFSENGEDLLKDAMGPLTIPSKPLLMGKFGLNALRSAESFVKNHFSETQAKALFAGCAGHSILPFNKSLSAAVGMIFAVQAHMVDWPIVKGGSQNLGNALAAFFKTLGGEIRTSTKVKNLNQLPDAKVFLFDTDPLQLATIASEYLPASYRKKLENFRYGPGIFKVDWALSESIPWKDSNTLKASTVHVGGKFEEIAKSEADMWNGNHNEKPYLILCQQSEFDRTRAPESRQTGYAYCHVPQDSTQDMTDIIEKQIERFAPGFRDTILAKNTMNTKSLQEYNSNYYGGAITGGVADLNQFFFRPTARLDPYSTPNNKIFICSASTPPGGGVHGMCGYHAASSVLRKVFDLKPTEL